MSNKSPKIIVNIKYQLAQKNHDNKRNKVSSAKRSKDVNGMFDYFSETKKQAVGMFDYYTGGLKEEEVNLVLENGKYATKSELNKRKEEYSKYIENSNLWKGVISFNNDYIEANTTLKDLEQKIIKNAIPSFLERLGLDPKKCTYQLALHTDTDNYHIHFSFAEKEPASKKKRNNNYRRKGNISNDEINFLKRAVALNIERDKCYKPLVKEINNNYDNVAKFFSNKNNDFIMKNVNSIKTEENIHSLAIKLRQLKNTDNNFREKKIYFNTLPDSGVSKDIKRLVRSIKKDIFNDKSNEVYKEMKQLKKSYEELTKYFKLLDEENNVKTDKTDDSYIRTKDEKLNTYIYNSILNSAIEIDKDLNLNKKNNKKEIRSNIIKNYKDSFRNRSTSSFKYKHKVEQALKNLNNEMEKEIEEYKKMFQVDKGGIS